MLIDHPGFYSVVAEEAGTIVGSNFMDERSTIFGIGPISVAPEGQNHAVGRGLMCAALERAAAKAAAGIRLVQAGYPGISSYVRQFARARQVWSNI
jgi:predicted N-acetyltransferase YhbS